MPVHALEKPEISRSYLGHAEAAELIFCPYNYILDPVIRRAVQIDLQDAVIILDEAHNIEDICRCSSVIQCQPGFDKFQRSRTCVDCLPQVKWQ